MLYILCVLNSVFKFANTNIDIPEVSSWFLFLVFLLSNLIEEGDAISVFPHEDSLK